MMGDKFSVSFWGLISLIVVLIIMGIIYLSFGLLWRRGLKKLGLILPIVLIIGLYLFVFGTSFSDSLFFSKSDVEKILLDYKFVFKDKFTIVSNKTDTWKNFHQDFKLKISENDKNRFIQIITSAKSYQENHSDNTDLMYNSAIDTLFTNNYQTKDYYIFEYFNRNKNGIKLLHDRIFIPKENDELYFDREIFN